MKVPLAKVERRVVTSCRCATVTFGKGLGLLSKRRRKRKLIGAPKSYLDYLDREGPILARRLNAFFKKESERVSRILARRSGLKKDDADDIIDDLDMSDWDVLVGVFSDSLSEQAQKQSRGEFGTIGFDADSDMTRLVDRQAVDWARQHAASLVGKRFASNGNLINGSKDYSISETTRSELRDLVSIALDEGLSASELSDEIQGGWLFSDSRASTIARTELSTAHAQGSLLVWQASGVVEQKQAILGSEHDLDDECDDNADDGPIAVDEPFSSGDLMHPFHPNCVCVVVALTSDEAGE